MTGGRAYLWDPSGRHVAALHAPSVRAARLVDAAATREDGDVLVAELRRLLGAHRDAGSALAARLLEIGDAVLADVWLVEPVPAAPVVVAAGGRRDGAGGRGRGPGGRPATRNRTATGPSPERCRSASARRETIDRSAPRPLAPLSPEPR